MHPLTDSVTRQCKNVATHRTLKGSAEKTKSLSGILIYAMFKSVGGTTECVALPKSQTGQKGSKLYS